MARKKISTKKRLSIWDILKGKFLVEDASFSNWKFLFFIIGLAFISITSSHQIDKKVVQISHLKERVSELNSAYTHLHRRLMHRKREVIIRKKINPYGIDNSNDRPYKITQIVHE